MHFKTYLSETKDREGGRLVFSALAHSPAVCQAQVGGPELLALHAGLLSGWQGSKSWH